MLNVNDETLDVTLKTRKIGIDMYLNYSGQCKRFQSFSIIGNPWDLLDSLIFTSK